MKSNSIRIQIQGADGEVHLQNIERWPNRCEIKRVGAARAMYFYSGDTLLGETGVYTGKLPDAFGLQFKRVVSTHVDFKTKSQSITAIFTTYDILNNLGIMHELTGYDE
jgi:hypothetical protein